MLVKNIMMVIACRVSSSVSSLVKIQDVRHYDVVSYSSSKAGWFKLELVSCGPVSYSHVHGHSLDGFGVVFSCL